MISYWEMFVERALHGKWVAIPRNRFTPVVLDVGAHRGMFCRLIKSLNQQAQVIAFEPQQVMLDSLKTCGYLSIEQVALSNFTGNHTMHVAESCAHMDQEFGRDFTSTIDVPVKTLDSYGYRMVDVLKIDVEGHLIGVLQGATETLKGTKCLVLEICSDNEMDQVVSILGNSWHIEKLDAVNYAFTRLSHGKKE